MNNDNARQQTAGIDDKSLKALLSYRPQTLSQYTYMHFCEMMMISYGMPASIFKNLINRRSANHIDILTLKSIFYFVPKTEVDASGFSEKDVMDFLRKVFDHRKVSFSQSLPEPFVFNWTDRRKTSEKKTSVSVKIELSPELKNLLQRINDDDHKFSFPPLDIPAEEKKKSLKTRAGKRQAFKKMLSQVENGKNNSFRKAIDQHLQNIAKKLNLGLDLNFHSFQAAIEEYNFYTLITPLLTTI